MEANERTVIENKILKLMADFNQNGAIQSGILRHFHRFDIKNGEYDKRRLIRYVVGQINGFVIDDMPIEKVNWEILFNYKNLHCSVAHQKFGFYLYIDNSVDPRVAEKISEEIQAKINKALSLAELIVRDEATKSIKRGEVIVENKYHELHRMYLYFKTAAGRKQHENTKAIETLINQDIERPSRSKKELDAAVARIKAILDQHSRPEEKTRFNEEAAYIAFFSLLEHLCVLGLAFTRSKYKKNLSEFIGLNWAGKFKEVFPLSDPEFKKAYDLFCDLAKYRRNASAHGYLDKMHTSFAFYFEPARHRIPVSVYDDEIITRWHDKDINLKALDDFLLLISKHPQTKGMMKYISHPFDVSYDADSLKKYRKIANYTDRGLERFIESESWRHDAAANMDFGFL